MSFNDWLQNEVLERDIGYKELAKASRLPIYTITAICKDQIKVIDWQIPKIANGLGIDSDIIKDIISNEKRMNLESVNGSDFSFENKRKIEKPGKKTKTAKISNSTPRLHDIKLPKEKHCRNCGQETGTECMRHSESRVIKFLDGGGIIGGKINDNLSAWLCMQCDGEMSYPLPKNASEQRINNHALKWALAIIRTHLL